MGSDIEDFSPRDTFTQNAHILGTMRQYDNPYYIELGIPEGAVTGANVAIFSAGTLIRSLEQTFSVCDTVARIAIDDIIVRGTVCHITMSVTSVYNVTTRQTFSI